MNEIPWVVEPIYLAQVCDFLLLAYFDILLVKQFMKLVNGSAPCALYDPLGYLSCREIFSYIYLTPLQSLPCIYILVG